MHSNWYQKYKIIHLNKIDSTSSKALQMIYSGLDKDTIILSKIQTKGRGSKGRSWESLEGNLHASIVLKVHFNLEKSLQLAFVVSSTLLTTINNLAKEQNITLDIKLKWPNDVLVNDKKLAGVLIEFISLKNSRYIIIGIGVNINKAPELNRKTTCIKNLGLSIHDTNIFFNRLMLNFEKAYYEWITDNNFTKTRKNWIKYAYHLGKMITIDNGVSRISGIFKGMNLDGSICLQLGKENYCNITIGEMLF